MAVHRDIFARVWRRHFLRRVFFGLAVMSLLVAGGGDSRAEPLAVASIKPVHALLAAIMAGVGEPALIVEGTASPHGYSLRPSQASRLQEADLIAWIGVEVETFLLRPIATLGAGAEVLTLSHTPGLAKLAPRQGGVFGANHDHDPGDGEAAAVDGHIWLDPLNASAIGRAMAAALVAIDPDNAVTYRANAVALGERLDALMTELTGRLSPVRARPYIVLHDAYHYFEKRFQLAATGSISETPDQKPGAARVAALQRAIRDDGAVCVFSEPQVEPGLIALVSEGAAVRLAALDPLGAAIDAGPELYFTLMRSLADGIVACLSDET